jgi:arabinan endo-1,5-alpha-L-arabinosidase
MKDLSVSFKKRETAIRYLFRLIVIHCCFLLLPVAASAQTGDVIFVHDPCIIKSAGYYYIFSTGDRIEMRRSADMQQWKRLKQVFPSIPDWGVQEVPGVSNIWAPDVFYRDSTYYLYYSLSTFGSNRSRIGLASNQTLDPDSPSYQWLDQGKVTESNSDDSYNAIDPNVVRDNEGKLWLSFGSFWSGIKMIELDSTTMKPKNGAALKSIASRANWGAIEAPFIIFKESWYYLFASFDACCQGENSTYKIKVGRSAVISGPYTDKNNLSMLNGGGSLVLAGDERWRGPGHCAVLQEGDSTWLVHHAYDAENNGIPTLRIEKLTWTEDGWPQIENVTSLDETKERQLPGPFSLNQNYPNPFNPRTEISFELPAAGFVSLYVSDINGKIIATLLNTKLSAGYHSIFFNADSYASGIYFYTVRTFDFRATRKMILVK